MKQPFYSTRILHSTITTNLREVISACRSRLDLFFLPPAGEFTIADRGD